MAFLDDNPELQNISPAVERQRQSKQLHQTFRQRHLSSDDGLLVSDSATSPPLASNNGHKRRRTNDMDPNSWTEDDGLPPPPPLHLLDSIVDIHFRTVHHWVPILHEARFLAKLADADERNRLAVLLHSLVAVSIKYLDVDKVELGHINVDRQIRLSRKVVMLHAMQSVSVENMQALIFLAFDYVSCLINCFSIPGSFTSFDLALTLSIADGMRLSLQGVAYHWFFDENSRISSIDCRIAGPILARATTSSSVDTSVKAARLDRVRRTEETVLECFPSRQSLPSHLWVRTSIDQMLNSSSSNTKRSWNTSLTSDHVQRRLPCSGAPWARQEAVSTPFFGIWNKTAAKIGKSIANVPTLYESPSKTNDYSPNGDNGVGGDQVDISNLGAFAYCIEATENLSQVTSFFLQQSIDFGDRAQVKNWLTRFKELDLRLVHWKMFLPHQWHDSDVSRDVSIVKMDPNLTLAHLTHNAATILLHQHIAYPPVTWCDVVKLPSSCSAETCQLAAVEIASIADKYLCYMGGIVNSQFAFCAFVAARILLVHWLSVSRQTDEPLAPEFFNLGDSLREMSRRWRGSDRSDDADNMGQPGVSDLMTKYAAQLQLMYSRYMAGLHTHASVGDMLSDASLDGLLDMQQQPTANSDSSLQNTIPPPMSGMGPGGTVATGMTSFAHPTSSLSQPPSRSHPPIAYDPRGTPVRYDVVSPRQRQRYGSYGQFDFGTNMGRAGPSNIPRGSSSSTANVAGLLGLRMENKSRHSNSSGFGGEDEDELFGQQFLEMDRVITLDGTDFFGGL
ncbi:uncharacterized protein N7503_007580 [Penicillium pulvis]|uniref:uncharacterized protein n=1 Tax=Penicillium pulvis TaxID=1562058 RepID=UPI002546ECC5|nr:uncharacterized protein N7503_007580 [Penicillium pulvis]KAJ5798284.1 hypothetical protein N7503_007580 [Penicillium pulvis]